MERFAVSPGATETYWDYISRLRVDLAGFKRERGSPLTQQQRLEVIDRWIAVIEGELQQLGVKPSSDEPTQYLCCRSHGDHRLFVVCYADRFYEDVPLEVRNRGPWRGERGEVMRLKLELRLALAQAGYVLINCPDAIFEPEVCPGLPR